MALAAGENIIATTLERYLSSGKATDNIFGRLAVLDFLKRRAKIDVQGGRNAVYSVSGVKNASFTAYSGSDTLVTSDNEQMTTAEYDWKQASIAVPITGIDEAKNSGDKAVIKLLQAKMDNAEMAAAEAFEDMFFNEDGAGGSGVASVGSVNSKLWPGLPYLLATTTGADAGGIDCSVETWWASYVNAPGIDTDLSLRDLATGYNSVSYGADKCDFEVTTQTLYEEYEALLQPQQRFTDANTGKAGFDNLIHKGGVVVWSDQCPAKAWYFLNSRHIKLVALSGNWMKFKGFVTPYNVDARYGLILSYGTFATDGRRYLGKLTDRVAGSA